MRADLYPSGVFGSEWGPVCTSGAAVPSPGALVDWSRVGVVSGKNSLVSSIP